mmetsp:Transcript_31639/g.48164  ORF Transcript_31639/g.48164 Transcript_31639/m.48164 type:complete len:189 (+) Transcript_31639:43-609(+)
MKEADGKKISRLQDQLILIRRTMMVRDQLKRIRLQREQAKCDHEDSCNKAKEQLSSLCSKLKEKMKKNQHIHKYLKAMTESYGEKVPTFFILKQQTALLRCLHHTEVFRNQWEILFNQLIRTTQDMMQKHSLLKGSRISQDPVPVPESKLSPKLKKAFEEDQWTIIFTFFSHEICSIKLPSPRILMVQ